MRLTVLGVALLASASALGEGYITSVRLPDGTTKTFQDAGARQEIQDIKSDLDPLLFAQYYPEGNVKSVAEFTSGIKYGSFDDVHRTVSVLPFCNTGTATDDNSNLSGRVVIPPFVDAQGNPYITDDGTRFKVVRVADGSPGGNNANLTDIIAPNTVTSIGESAFRSCTSLYSVSLPAATEIWDSAFDSCTNLTSVDFGDTPRSEVPSLGEGAFVDVPTSCRIIVPYTQYDAWKAANGWKDLPQEFVRHAEKSDKPATFTTGNLAEFDSQGNPIDSFIAATNVALKTDISPTEPAFSNAVLAVGLGIDTNTVAAINELVDSTHGLPVTGAASVGALLLALAAAIAALKRGKASKSDLALRPTMFDIGGGVWVFANDGEGFVVINGEVTTLPASKTSIEEGEYADNPNLSVVYAPNVTSAGRGAFANCTTLTSVSLPAVTWLESDVFSGCSALTTLNLSSLSIAYVQANANIIGINPPSGRTVTITCSDGTFTITGD